ncbi:unnamed protein product [Cyprideis torosa]|uniref:Transmembrane protein 107 n=1 Tax=Cyprideis torosa TaxID=163714 RepID=A0A7R8W9N2_9CRUS|nr:unnamed protein product [Cyprideis torosa]CAG0885502.1 unnamed protein product [Cyprideis torosa]
MSSRAVEPELKNWKSTHCCLKLRLFSVKFCEWLVSLEVKLKFRLFDHSIEAVIFVWSPRRHVDDVLTLRRNTLLPSSLRIISKQIQRRLRGLLSSPSNSTTRVQRRSVSRRRNFKMQVSDPLLAGRFLCLLAHACILIVSVSFRQGNVLASLPLEADRVDYEAKDVEVKAAEMLSLSLLTLESSTFFGGLSMFNPSQALLSMLAHGSGAIAMSFFLMDQWDMFFFYWHLAFCSVLPLLTEVGVFVNVVILGKRL